MISWAEIRSEYENINLGFRERVVGLFRRYEGQETDETVRGKVVLVTANSFAKKMGIKQPTFAGWLKEFGLSNVDNRQPAEATPSCMNEGVPPAEGFVREVNTKLYACLKLLPELSEETHQLIAEDIEETRKILDTIEANLKVSHK